MICAAFEFDCNDSNMRQLIVFILIKIVFYKQLRERFSFGCIFGLRASRRSFWPKQFQAVWQTDSSKLGLFPIRVGWRSTYLFTRKRTNCSKTNFIKTRFHNLWLNLLFPAKWQNHFRKSIKFYFEPQNNGGRGVSGGEDDKTSVRGLSPWQSMSGGSYFFF